jgi:hypothetical protein
VQLDAAVAPSLRAVCGDDAHDTARAVGARLEVADVVRWDVHAVCSWFAKLELGCYAETVRANSVDGSMLLGLSDEDLSELGIANKFHRRKVLLHRDRVLSGAALWLRSEPPTAAAAAGPTGGFLSAHYVPVAREWLPDAPEPGSRDVAVGGSGCGRCSSRDSGWGVSSGMDRASSGASTGSAVGKADEVVGSASGTGMRGSREAETSAAGPSTGGAGERADRNGRGRSDASDASSADLDRSSVGGPSESASDANASPLGAVHTSSVGSAAVWSDRPNFFRCTA